MSAEWIKIRTLRSTVVLLALTVALAAGLGYLVGWSFGRMDLSVGRFDAVFASFYGLSIAQLALVAFAVLAVGGEYSCGTIRPSLSAVPRRGAFYLAKVATIALCATAVALVSVAVSFAAAQAGLGARHTSPTAPGMPATIAGAVLYLLLITLFAAGVAQLARSSALALGILLPLLLLGSQGLGNIPRLRTVTQFLPDQSGMALLHFFGPPDDPGYDRPFGPWAGLAVTALWTLAALTAGYLTLRRRDA